MTRVQLTRMKELFPDVFPANEDPPLSLMETENKKVSLSLLRDVDNKMSTDELRSIFIPRVGMAFDDRVKSMEKLTSADASVTIPTLSAARAATFAQWHTTKPFAINGESTKVAALHQLKNIMHTNAPSMWKLWGFSKPDNVDV
jgi:hypothetical protein